MIIKLNGKNYYDASSAAARLKKNHVTFRVRCMPVLKPVNRDEVPGLQSYSKKKIFYSEETLDSFSGPEQIRPDEKK